LDQESAKQAKELEESVENVAEERVNGLTKQELADEINSLRNQIEEI